MRPAFSILVCLLVVVASGTAVVSAETEEEFDPDNIVIDIFLPGDDRSLWTIEHRYVLEDDAAEAAFADLEADIAEHHQDYRDQFEERMVRTAETAEDATGRSMSIENVNIDTETRELPRRYGIIRYTFEWHGFAVSTDETISAGDAIAGLFLDEETNLRKSWTANHTVADVTPTPDQSGDHSVIWRGPTEFDSDEPHLILESVEEDSPPPDDEDQTPPADEEDSTSPSGDDETALPADDEPIPHDPDEGWSLLTIGGVVLIVVLVGTGVAGWRYRQLFSGTSPAEAPDEPPVDQELMSNEEQVLGLLAANGGRMKQQEVVTALDWTDAKTSQVVSDLREVGEIESFRLGRENVLRVAEEPDNDE